MKKVLSFIIALCLICTLLPATVLAADTEIVFQLGANGSASHNDGSEKSSYSETVNGYTLSLTGGSKMYTGARDVKGNSCIKLGTGSAAGKFSFTVPNDVTSVKIAVAKYKANTSKVTINGTTTTLTKNSNNGEYDIITVDTSSTKTVSVTTVSGGYRAMVNSITFVIPAAEPEPDVPTCEHTNKVAIGVAKDATCTEDGITAGVKCADCGEEITAQETIKATGHKYVDGICSVCDEEEPKPTTVVITITNSSGKVYAMTNANGTGSAPSAVAITPTIKNGKIISEVADNLKWTMVLDGDNLIFHPGEDTTKWLYCTSTNNGVRVGTNTANTFTIDSASGYLKHVGTNRYIGVYNAQDWRCYTNTTGNIANQTLAIYELDTTTCLHTNTKAIGEAKDATCTEPGITAGEKCADCDVVITEQEVIPAGHKYENGVCSVCGHKLANEATITFDDTSKRTEFNTSQQVWEENDIAVTNDKASSASGMGDYCKPVRFYKSSTLTITYGAAMGQIIFDCYDTSHANVIEETLTSAGGTVQQYSDKIVFVPASAEVSFTFTLTAAAWIDSITVICTAAEVDGTPYTSLDAALKNNAGTLKLLANQIIDQVDFKDVVLDLNGKTLTVNSINATVKDSRDGAGLIKVAKDGAVLYNVDSQMILWDNTDDASGYRVFNYTWNNLDGIVSVGAAKENETTTNRTFWSVLQFENQNAYKLIAAADLEVGFQVSWTPEGGAKSTTSFDFERSVITDWADDQIGSSTIYGFYIRLYGFEEIAANGTIEVTPVVKTTFTTVETETTTYEYSGN